MGDVVPLHRLTVRKSAREATLSAMLDDTADLMTGLIGASEAERVAIQAQVEAIHELVGSKT